jgi:N,N'-diacetylbacillosaminyl-diphospho-undecaprenol alpha-1,3-N-acetylgalactosaminyltransferase
MVSRVVETKGVREFIEASKIVAAARPGTAVFLLFGDVEPDNPETLSAEYVRSNQNDEFRWLGWTDRVREALALSDVVVLPSYREGTPRSLLEAMAMGKPIVTTDAPGCTNVIENGRNGFMVPVRDAQKLAHAILELINDPGMREAFGRRSYEKARDEFEETNVSRAIIDQLYKA